MKYALVVLIVTFVKQSEQYDCKTPIGDDGNCINISTCKPILDNMKSIEMTQKLYQCDHGSNDTKVCCPDKLDTRPDFTKHKNFHLLPERCGSLNAADHITFGTVAEAFTYPWAALLFYPARKGLVHKCGGSLINKRYVLTAAHCITQNVVSVRIGEHNLTTPEDCYEIDNKQVCEKVQNIAVAKIIIHPGYVNKIGLNDIALLRLGSDVDTSKINANPICLPIQGHTTKLRGTAIGWGATDKSTYSDVLLQVELPLINSSACQVSYKQIPEVTISSKQFCAGDADGDACLGDGGGPLFEIDFYTPNRVAYIQYGVVSFGPIACVGVIPGVYTKISEYVDWILDNLVE